MNARPAMRRTSGRHAAPLGTHGATLERACLHEVAHLAVARALGACGFVRIVRLHADGEGAERYGGTFQLHGDLTEREWRVVALAGTLAEWIAEGIPPEVAAVAARLAADGEALSDIDARLAAGYDDDDVRSCLDALRTNWAAIVRDADERVRDVRGTVG